MICYWRNKVSNRVWLINTQLHWARFFIIKMAIQHGHVFLHALYSCTVSGNYCQKCVSITDFIIKKYWSMMIAIIILTLLMSYTFPGAFNKILHSLTSWNIYSKNKECIRESLLKKHMSNLSDIFKGLQITHLRPVRLDIINICYRINRAHTVSKQDKDRSQQRRKKK